MVDFSAVPGSPGTALIEGVGPGQAPERAATSGTTVSLSADGTTVAWLGYNIAEQAPSVAPLLGGLDDGYDEPLWRRVADGAAATMVLRGPSGP